MFVPDYGIMLFAICGYGNALWGLDVKFCMVIDFEQSGSRYIIWTSVWMGHTL